MRGWRMWMFVGMVALVGCSKPDDATSGGGTVVFNLNWVPEPEFGGIYAARQIGAFSRHGLDVDIRPGGAGTPTWQLVAAGKADFAVASADEVLIARSRGADVVAIFATYHTCPQGIMVHASRGLKSIAEVFQSGTLAIEPGLPYASFLKNKYGFDRIKVIAYDGGITAFLNDKNLAQQCFITSEPLLAKRQGSDLQVFLIADAGYNPYTAVVITRGQLLRDSPQLVKAMVESLRQGWRAYLDDPRPANQIMGELNRQMDAATFAAAAEAQKPLIETGEGTPLGIMTRQRWETLGQQLVELKVIDRSPDIDKCFADVDKEQPATAP